MSDDAHKVTILYKNHRLEEAVRHITPRDIRFGSSQYHPDPQWLLDAFDHDRQAERTFAMKDIQAWETRKP